MQLVDATQEVMSLLIAQLCGGQLAAEYAEHKDDVPLNERQMEIPSFQAQRLEGHTAGEPYTSQAGISDEVRQIAAASSKTQSATLDVRQLLESRSEHFISRQ